jgi:DNA mismatch repair protein MutS
MLQQNQQYQWNFLKYIKDRDIEHKTNLLREQESQKDICVNEIRNILGNVEISQTCKSHLSHLGTDVFDDVEMFRPYREGESVIFASFGKPMFKGTEIYLRTLLSNPINSIEILQQRRDILEKIENSFVDVQKTLDSIKETESDILWFYQENEKNLQSLYDMPFFKMWLTKKLNESPRSLTFYNLYQIFVSPLIGILSPLTYFIVPFMVLKYKYKFNIAFKTYVRLLFSSSQMMMTANGWSKGMHYISILFSLVFYFQSMFNSIEVSRTLFSVSKLVSKKMENIHFFINTAIDILHQYNYTINADCFFDLKEIDVSIVKKCSASKKLGGVWFLSNFGSLLKQYKCLDKYMLLNLIKGVYVIDSLFTIVKTKQVEQLTYADYKMSNYTKDDTILSLKGFWHPCISKNRSIKNNVESTQRYRNMIITGPNAGGKSTTVKSILSNILLSQTICIVYAENCVITPFGFINSQINVPDCKGKESLFQAEMKRCKYIMERLNERVEENSPSIVFMDEILSSTNPVEGIAGSYAILKKLATYKMCTVIFTTHFNYLSTLQKDTDDTYRNFKMNVEIDFEKNINFTYQLQKGVSSQYIALYLLEKQGFDKEIIETAIAIKDKLTKKKEKVTSKQQC